MPKVFTFQQSARQTGQILKANYLKKKLFAVSSSNTDYGKEKENLVLSFSLKQTKRKLGSSLIPWINRRFSNSPGIYSNLGEDKVEESQHMKQALAGTQT